MADKEAGRDSAKTHRVRLGGAWTYERHYPNADPLVIHFPAGATVEMTDESYQSLQRMNAHTGRPTMHLEKLGEGDAVDMSIPDVIKRVEADMTERGVSLTATVSAPTVGGKYKGMFAAATGDSKFSKAPATDEGTATMKGGK